VVTHWDFHLHSQKDWSRAEVSWAKEMGWGASQPLPSSVSGRRQKSLESKESTKWTRDEEHFSQCKKHTPRNRGTVQNAPLPANVHWLPHVELHLVPATHWPSCLSFSFP
jgi:hypothetical protein